MTPRIQKAIDIFLDAINEGHLAKGHCAACAVGNLCANAISYKPELSDDINQPNMSWRWLFCTYTDGAQEFREGDSYRIDMGITLIKQTDFSESELAKIENAFELNTQIFWEDYKSHSSEEIRADQIRGLNSVVKVMLDFDNQKDDVNEVFTKRAELIPV